MQEASCRELSGVERYGKEMESLSSQLQELDAMLSDFGRELESCMEDLEFSEQEYQETEERLNQINHLKAKYGQTIEEIQAAAQERNERLDLLMNLGEHKEKLERELIKAGEVQMSLCDQAHEIREHAAGQLAELMKAQLAELNFLDVEFEIAVQRMEEPGADGADDVEFLISTNPGESLKPLGRIASGGELSRVMLAIKTVLADQDAIETVIFDEIDTGISGRTAQKVSEKMAVIGKCHQVLCITHLPQIAAMADTHFEIEKHQKGTETITEIHPLEGDDSVRELARLLGGAELTQAVFENAKEMKELARVHKNTRLK